MDDPWSAGPSWGSAKPSSSASKDETIDRGDTFTPPPGGFDVSDPWGTGAGSGVGIPGKLPGEDAVKIPERSQPLEEEGGWGGGGSTPAWDGARNLGPDEGDTAVVNLNDTDDHDEDVAAQGVWTSRPDADQQESQEDEADHTSKVASPVAARSPSPVIERQSSPIFPPPELEGAFGQSSSPTTVPDFGASLPALSSPPTFNIPTDLPSFDPPSPENAFASSLPTFDSPKSPSFGDDAFGGFSTGISGSDPWGGGAGGGVGGDGWGSSFASPNPAGGFAARHADEESDAGSDVGDGWGGVKRSASTPRIERDQEYDWEEAQRRMRLQEDRAPREKIEKIKDEWKAVVLGLVVESLEAYTEVEEDKLKAGLRELESETYEKCRSLSMIPPDINTYPPVISSLTTHERHVYALSRPNPAPSTSLISTTLARKPKRTQTLEQESPWLTRSKLGEPEAPIPESSPLVPETSGSRWSFWRKAPQERPLVTSGGAVLEVKSPVTPVLTRTSSEIKSNSKPPSVMSRNSRPSSPAPPVPASTSIDDFGFSTPGGMVESASASSITQATPAAPAAVTAQATAPAPSAVSRFFGRLGRSKAPIQTETHDDSHDLEISADDFNYLSEIPALSKPEEERGVGDLLSLQPGRTEQMASLESMLASKPAIMAAPLAPPPRVGPTSRSASYSSTRIVPPSKSSDMDLLGGLDFGDSPSSAPPPPIQNSQPAAQAVSSSMWDDFLAPAPSKSTPSPGTSSANLASPIAAPLPRPPPGPIPGPNASPLPPFSSPLAPSSSRPTPPPKPVQGSHNSMSSFGDFDDFDLPTSSPSVEFASMPSTTISSTKAAASSSFAAPSTHCDDFDDFGTPQNASVATFDNFDLSSFDTPAPKRTTVGSPGTLGKSHPTRTSLDHTPTISLMAGASASKGKQWPAPPSPIGLPLAPPPRAGNASSSSAGFPFLSPPPPPSRSPAGASRNASGVDLLRGEQAQSVSTARGIAPTPPRGATPLQPQTSSTMSRGGTGGSQGGLTATDLSFFDSL